ncbi:hypothetical protein OC834_000754 [Tilletia horrida]|nr:hypothetical protein OC834_000754 [Tilletia horrida]
MDAWKSPASSGARSAWASSGGVASAPHLLASSRTASSVRLPPNVHPTLGMGSRPSILPRWSAARGSSPRAHLHWSALLHRAGGAPVPGPGPGPTPGVGPSAPPPPLTSDTSNKGTSGSNSNKKGNLPRGLAFVRRHPLLTLSSFILTHVGTAWLLLPPTYFVMHNLTPGGATTMLAGPQTAWVLSQSVPSTMASTVPGFKKWSQERLTQGRQATFEDLLEYFARNASKMAWRGARSTIGLVSSVRKPSSSQEAREEEEMADEAIRSLKGKKDADVTKTALDKLGFSQRAQNVASDIRFAQVRDAVAAYVFVKTLFPLRLPLSLFLAPKVARGIMRMMRR